MQTFDLATVLTITTGRLLTDVDHVYEILNYMTGENLFTHQLPRAGRECAPALLAQFPELAGCFGNNVTTENWREWLAEWAKHLPATFVVAPLPDHTGRNPFEELAEMIEPEKIITVVTD